MVNHVRTFLMNRGRNGRGIDQPGEEFVYDKFIPRVLTPGLVMAHKVLFGGQPDRLFLMFRMRQLMQLIHASPLADDVLVKDSRITYLPFDDTMFSDVFKRTVTIQGSSNPTLLHIYGQHVPDMQKGVIEQIWDIFVTGEGVIRIVNRSTGQIVDHGTAVNDELRAPLHGTGLHVHIQAGFLPPLVNLRIVSRVRPDGELAAVLHVLQATLGQSGLSDIFKLPLVDPYITWYSIYNDPVQPFAMRMAALFLAMAERTESLPQVS